MTDMDRAGGVWTALLDYIDARGHAPVCPVSMFVGEQKCECGYDTLRAAIAHPPAPAGGARAEPYVPKVGDRVRYPDGTPYVVKKHNAGSEYPFAVFDLRAGTDNAFMPGYLTYDGPATPAERAEAGIHDAGGVGEKGYELTSAPKWINEAANAIMGEVIAATAPDADLSDEEDYASLRGTIEGVIMRAMPHPAPDAGGVGEAKAVEQHHATYGEGYIDGWHDRDGEHGKDPERGWKESASRIVVTSHAHSATDPRRGESGEAIDAQGGRE